MTEISGRYRSSGGSSEIELRVDIDGEHPLKRISGDIFKRDGEVLHYEKSFLLKEFDTKERDDPVLIEGRSSFSDSSQPSMVRIHIPHPREPAADPGPALVEFSDADGNVHSSYHCKYKSKYFRTVEFEQDAVFGVSVFRSFNTGLLSGGAGREIGLIEAYQDAGIELRDAGNSSVVPPHSEFHDAENPVIAGHAAWTDAELHRAMIDHFSSWDQLQEIPEWRIWVLAANAYSAGLHVHGMMFDKTDERHRQGCAIFYDAIKAKAGDANVVGTSPEELRLQLHTYVHEIGHCFNLQHEGDKALSWMTVPFLYDRNHGKGEFWKGFKFCFDDLGLDHLRHGFRNIAMPGQAPFLGNPALAGGDLVARGPHDELELRLESAKPRPFVLGEPVVVEIRLSLKKEALRNGRRVAVHTHLQPKLSYLKVKILNPEGTLVRYQPPMSYLVAPGEPVVLDSTNPSIYASIYIGYGKDGLYFDRPGDYKIQAIYYAINGLREYSNELSITVRRPENSDEKDIANLYNGTEQGMLFYMLGSDSPSLGEGDKALAAVERGYPDHPLAVYAYLARGINAGREFKTILPGKKFSTSAPDYEQSIRLLAYVIACSGKPGSGVDNITLNYAMRYKMQMQKACNKHEDAAQTRREIPDTFRKRGVTKPHVLKWIETQANAILPAKGDS